MTCPPVVFGLYIRPTVLQTGLFWNLSVAELTTGSRIHGNHVAHTQHCHAASFVSSLSRVFKKAYEKQNHKMCDSSQNLVRCLLLKIHHFRLK